MNIEALANVARALSAPGKGILAADDSSRTVRKRFEAFNIEFGEETCRDFREMLFGSEEALSQYISGVILHDEITRQVSSDAEPFPKLIARMGAIPGIKVDEGTRPLVGFPGEQITVGIDRLAERLSSCIQMGTRFAKWRAVIEIGADFPSAAAINANAQLLARFAAECQAAAIVPMVEPEVVIDGPHDMDRCEDVTRRLLSRTFEELKEHRVVLEGLILKPNMITPGSSCTKSSSVKEVAQRTVEVLKSCVPAAVPGIAFLSGGQSDESATAHLDAMNRLGELPWKLTFSYGRALQAAPLRAWSGKSERLSDGRAAFIHRAFMNSLASKGQWNAELEKSCCLASK